jgi:hypothetical protein
MGGLILVLSTTRGFSVGTINADIYLLGFNTLLGCGVHEWNNRNRLLLLCHPFASTVSWVVGTVSCPRATEDRGSIVETADLAGAARLMSPY